MFKGVLIRGVPPSLFKGVLIRGVPPSLFKGVLIRGVPPSLFKGVLIRGVPPSLFKGVLIRGVPPSLFKGVLIRGVPPSLFKGVLIRGVPPSLFKGVLIRGVPPSLFKGVLIRGVPPSLFQGVLIRGVPLYNIIATHITYITKIQSGHFKILYIAIYVLLSFYMFSSMCYVYICHNTVDNTSDDGVYQLEPTVIEDRVGCYPSDSEEARQDISYQVVNILQDMYQTSAGGSGWTE